MTRIHRNGLLQVHDNRYYQGESDYLGPVRIVQEGRTHERSHPRGRLMPSHGFRNLLLKPGRRNHTLSDQRSVYVEIASPEEPIRTIAGHRQAGSRKEIGSELRVKATNATGLTPTSYFKITKHPPPFFRGTKLDVKHNQKSIRPTRR